MTIQITREQTLCCHYMGYSFRLPARVLLYAPSHRQDSTYHDVCYTGPNALAGMRNSWMGSSWRFDLTTHCTRSENYHRAWSHECMTMKHFKVCCVKDPTKTHLISSHCPLHVKHLLLFRENLLQFSINTGIQGSFMWTFSWDRKALSLIYWSWCTG